MKKIDQIIEKKYLVAAFYDFFEISDENIFQITSELTWLAKNYKIKGTVLVALEGVNGTICGPQEGISKFFEKLSELIGREKIDVKYSWSSKQAFRRFKARKKKEIVTIGIQELDPTQTVGTYIEPCDWNDFLKDPNSIVIDTRNAYEISVGTFEGSLNPNTTSFREFPAWVEKYLRPLLQKNTSLKVGMFCTGGIRCEKATSYLKREGFVDVHHLHGGILKYLEDIPENESLWSGECFVFDQRVSLDHQLSPGTHQMCHACGMPISPEDLKKTTYIKGIQCERCIDKFSDSDRLRFSERQRQIDELMKRLPDNSLWPSS